MTFVPISWAQFSLVEFGRMSRPYKFKLNANLRISEHNANALVITVGTMRVIVVNLCHVFKTSLRLGRKGTINVSVFQDTLSIGLKENASQIVVGLTMP
jgi:hypothetical protein